MRIVSLLPSATEIVCGLGLQHALGGVTHECDFPSGVLDIPRVTKSLIPHDAASGEIDQLVKEQLSHDNALYRLDHDAILSLQPDLIITQTLCDVCAVSQGDVNAAIQSLPTTPQVLNLEPLSLADMLRSIEQVGDATQHAKAAEIFVASLQQRIDAIRTRSESVTARPRVMLLEWIDPLFSAGHWNPELIQLAGGQPLLSDAGTRSQQVPWTDLISVDPEVLVIACCGFEIQRAMQDVPILQQHPAWNDLTCVRNAQVFVVDGSAYFNRPGPRLVDSLEILARIIHPNVHPAPNVTLAAVRVPSSSIR